MNNNQEKILYLLIKYKELYDELIASVPAEELFNFFDPSYKYVVECLGYCNTLNIFLTKNVFEEYVSRKISNKIEVLAQNKIFYKIISYNDLDKNDFPVYVEALKYEYLKEKSTEYIDVFLRNSKSNNKNYKENIHGLSDSLSKLLDLSDSSESLSWFSLKDYGDSWYNELKNSINNPEEKILCSIKEIDESMSVGFRPGTLTLFAADVGSFKTTMMLNIALNIYNNGFNVMFVPLEMPKNMLMQKIISRETSIELNKIANPEKLTDIDKDKISKQIEKMKHTGNEFVILDPDERATAGSIIKEIEKRRSFFKPDIVVIDYISIMSPEKKYAKLNESSWYGQMCKDIRSAGKKYEFATISAVQLGRDAIKRVRNKKGDDLSFGSEDLRGSHDYSADADNIYAQCKDPANPSEKLHLFCIKSRYGPTTFGNSGMAVLDVFPSIAKISGSGDLVWNEDNLEEMCKSLESNVPDFDLSDDSLNFDSLAKNVNDIKEKEKQESSVIDDFDFLD